MNGYELIKFLQKYEPTQITPVGFTFAHSYRGDYTCLAFARKENTSIKYLLGVVEDAYEYPHYTGYKGGDYTMTERDEVYFTWEGCGFTGLIFTPNLLRFLFDTSILLVDKERKILDATWSIGVCADVAIIVEQLFAEKQCAYLRAI